MIRTILLIGLGGGIGSILRYLTSVLVNKYFTTTFPLATFIINMLGCFLIGVFMGFIEKGGTPDNYKYLFVTGFCGGYTTFSAFAFENSSLLNTHNTFIAFAYIAASVVAGMLFVWLGLLLGRWI
jgi:CrcB protein